MKKKHEKISPEADRILEILDYKGFNFTDLALSIGVTPQKVAYIKQSKKLSIDILQRVLRQFPEISADWLIKGEGSMLRSTQEKEDTFPLESGNTLDLRSVASSLKLLLNEKDERLNIQKRYIESLELQLDKYRSAEMADIG